MDFQLSQIIEAPLPPRPIRWYFLDEVPVDKRPTLRRLCWPYVDEAVTDLLRMYRWLLCHKFGPVTLKETIQVKTLVFNHMRTPQFLDRNRVFMLDDILAEVNEGMLETDRFLRETGEQEYDPFVCLAFRPLWARLRFNSSLMRKALYDPEAVERWISAYPHYPDIDEITAFLEGNEFIYADCLFYQRRAGANQLLLPGMP